MMIKKVLEVIDEREASALFIGLWSHGCNFRGNSNKDQRVIRNQIDVPYNNLNLVNNSIGLMVERVYLRFATQSNYKGDPYQRLSTNTPNQLM
jgi:hypothetical protein